MLLTVQADEGELELVAFILGSWSTGFRCRGDEYLAIFRVDYAIIIIFLF